MNRAAFGQLLVATTLGVVGFAALAGCTKSGPNSQNLAQRFQIPAHLNANDTAIVRQAIGIFLAACPGISQVHYSSYKVDEVENSYNPYDSIDTSWTTLVRIVISHQVPSLFGPGTDTENLYYDLGAGRDPGIRAGKHSSRAACGGFPANATWATLLPAPDLRIVNNLRLSGP